MFPFFISLVLPSLAAGVTKGIEVTQPTFLVAKQQEDAQIVCEYTNDGDATDLRIALLKQMGNESIKVCALSFTTNFELVSRKVGQCKVDLGHERVNVTLPQLQTTDAGLYICTMERIFPPPYYPVQGKGTHLYVIEKEQCPDIHLYFWIIMSVFAGLLGYSILLTACIMRKVIRKRSYYTPGVYEKFISK